MPRLLTGLLLVVSALPLAGQTRPLKVFVSVDMEGIGGIGTPAMTSSSGKDYATGRSLMTAEVNAVVETILAHGPADILVNDSHGDMQNLLHLELDPRVSYIQGSIKPYGMVQGLDSTFDAVIFVGYHARAGTRDGFIAHTGSGAVEGLWLNGTEVGEGGLNAFYAGAMGVPVLMASGDEAFGREIRALVPGIHTVATKRAVGSMVAVLVHPDSVRARLREAVDSALAGRSRAKAVAASGPVTVRLRFDTTTRADIVEVIPGVRRVDGTTVEWQAPSMREAYSLVRLMYRYVSW
ncbi:MAG: M55 family metallopeptidase [Gemmatimonadota bacterium]|jgi:D-amino peptidase|nr:M55 family metallopeptidase [Gemmatimonadota bacterium]